MEDDKKNWEAEVEETRQELLQYPSEVEFSISDKAVTFKGKSRDHTAISEQLLDTLNTRSLRQEPKLMSEPQGRGFLESCVYLFMMMMLLAAGFLTGYAYSQISSPYQTPKGSDAYVKPI